MTELLAEELEDAIRLHCDETRAARRRSLPVGAYIGQRLKRAKLLVSKQLKSGILGVKLPQLRVPFVHYNVLSILLINLFVAWCVYGCYEKACFPNTFTM